MMFVPLCFNLTSVENSVKPIKTKPNYTTRRICYYTQIFYNVKLQLC